MNPIDRLPPHNLEAERVLLGCVLLDPPSGVSACRDKFPQGEPFFYDPRHQTIFDALEGLLIRGEDADVSKLVVALENTGHMETVGGYPYISGLLDSSPSAAAIGYYLNLVHDRWTLRRLIRAGQSIVQNAYEAPSAQEASDFAEAQVMAVSRGESVQDQGAYDGEKLAKAAQESAEQRFEAAQDPRKRVLTGFERMDQLVRVRPGNLIVLAARPSVGKTSFALNLCLNIARSGIPVGFLSLEMSPPELAEQLACTVGEVDSQLIDRGMGQDDYARYADALLTITKLPIYVEGTFDCSIWKAKQRIRGLVQRYGVKAAFVDYLQLIGGDRKRDNRSEEVGSVSRGLKALAMELGIPVVALCQLNREIEKGGYRRPRKSDLRESGSIEQDADQVWFLHPAEETPACVAVPLVELIVDKQRRGATDIVPFEFRKRYTKFVEVPKS